MSASVLGVDTNVLARFLTRDDPEQAEKARQIITSPENQPIHVSLIVLVELVWILRKVKRWPAQQVFSACWGLLSSSDFLVEGRSVVEQCLIDAERAGCDLADAIIARMNAQAGCRTTVTFDHAAQNLVGMSPAETFA
jgi:predicted nucleic-acid-binding protein